MEHSEQIPDIGRGDAFESVRFYEVQAMETNQLHRGRLIDHLQLVVSNLEASRQFYTATLDSLGIPLGGEGPDFFWFDELVVSSKESVAAQGVLTGRSHFAFQAASPEQVEAFYRAGLSNGGKDNGAPGVRQSYHPGYFAAFLIDPDGNNVEVVHHGPARRSAPSVVIDF